MLDPVAVILRGVEFYTSCAHIRVGGWQTAMLNKPVLFPGAYTITTTRGSTI